MFVRRALLSAWSTKETAKRLKGALVRRDGSVVAIGGQDRHGRPSFRRLRPRRAVDLVARRRPFGYLGLSSSATATFGTIMAYVHEPYAANYKFTSAMPSQLLKALVPSLLRLIGRLHVRPDARRERSTGDAGHAWVCRDRGHHSARSMQRVVNALQDLPAVETRRGPSGRRCPAPSRLSPRCDLSSPRNGFDAKIASASQRSEVTPSSSICASLRAKLQHLGLGVGARRVGRATAAHAHRLVAGAIVAEVGVAARPNGSSISVTSVSLGRSSIALVQIAFEAFAVRIQVRVCS